MAAGLRLRRWMLPAAALLIVATVGVLISRRGTPPPPFRTALVQRGTVIQTVDVTGTLQPAAETDLDFGTSGHVSTVAVQAGQHVPAGTLLANLDTAAVVSQLDQARSALASAQAKLKLDEGGPNNSTEVSAAGAVSSARGAVGPAQLNLDDTRQLGRQVIEAAQIALQTALAAAQGQISADEATVAADQRSLFDVRVAGQQSVALATATFAQAEAQAQAAVATAQVSAVSGRRSLDDVQRVDGAAVESARVQVAAAAAVVAVDQHALQLDFAQLHQDQGRENSDCHPTPNANCQSDHQAVRDDQQRVNGDQQTLVKDEGAFEVNRTQVVQAQARLQADAGSAEQQLATAEVQLRSATAQLATTLRQGQAQVAEAQAQSQSNIDAAQATLTGATVQLQNARVAFTSAQQTNVNSVAQAQTRGVQGDHQAEAQVTGATIQLQNSLAQLSAVMGAIPQQVAMDEAQVQADQSQVTAAQDALAAAALIAPVDGVVEQVNVAQGQAIGGGTGAAAGSGAGALIASSASGGPTAGNNGVASLTHAIVLLTPTAFQVSGPVSDAQLHQIRLGNRVRVAPAGVAEQVDGSVTGIAPAALVNAGVSTFTVTATIAGGHPDLHPGSTAQMSIVVEEEADVLTVPTSAIHTSGSATYVLVPMQDQEVPRPVTVGASDPVRTQITSGLKAGDRVILARGK
ncbi:MAG TPA: biotin/lipoyl-binding protein [Candidatus Dormibacteraeota bacterium]|nr:biotin/lipoyl-binding protein [Candidatus Dormibacteraeota bacterium]